MLQPALSLPDSLTGRALYWHCRGQGSNSLSAQNFYDQIHSRLSRRVRKVRLFCAHPNLKATLASKLMCSGTEVFELEVPIFPKCITVKVTL